jgi:hypothetical protein
MRALRRNTEISYDSTPVLSPPISTARYNCMAEILQVGVMFIAATVMVFWSHITWPVRRPRNCHTVTLPPWRMNLGVPVKPLIFGALLPASTLFGHGAALAQTAVPSVVIDLTGQAAPHAPGRPYMPRNLPDRVILTPGADPATAMAVSWRTDMDQGTTEAEIAELLPAPNFGLRARAVAGISRATTSENGPARYHHVRFTGLSSDTAYAYRVRGAAGWSEWHQFRTAKTAAAPFTFLYMGDTQNSILDIGSLAWRRAITQASNPALMLHAGDLVSSRDDMVHDDEWGEWSAAGGWALATIPQVPAIGNHEYVDVKQPDGSETRRLGPHWPVMFALPDNGAPGVEATTWMTQWQGVRFIMLDGTSAIDLGTLDAQTQWLEAQLKASTARWNVVLLHQPIFTCARPNDTPMLKQAWVPIFERYRVDLVLQGHDHCYSRLTAAEGREASAKARKRGAAQGPVYMVSVAGSKMYALNDRSDSQPDRVAEDTSLFQVVDVGADRLTLKAFLNTGILYDGFTLERGRNGRNRLKELPASLPTVRRCQREGAGRTGPDGLPCTSRLR